MKIVTVSNTAPHHVPQRSERKLLFSHAPSNIGDRMLNLEDQTDFRTSYGSY